MKKRLLIVLILILLVGCENKNDNVINIGAILPLTGDAAVLGVETREGMEIALDELNKKEKLINVNFEDSKNNPATGVDIINKMISLNNFKYFISSMSGVTSSLIPIIDNTNSLLLATITAKPEITKEGNNIYRFYYTTDIQGKTVIEFATSELKLKKVGIFFLNDEYGISGTKYLEELQENYDFNIVWKEALDKQSVNYRSQVTKMRARSPEAVIIVAYGNELIRIIKQIKELKLNSKIFTYTGVANPEILNNLGELANDIYLSIGEFNPFNPSNDEQKEFFNKVEQRFNKQPSHYHAFGYDAIRILFKAISEVDNNDIGLIKENLNRLKNYRGILGNINVDKNREVILEQNIAVIKDRKIIMIENDK